MKNQIVKKYTTQIIALCVLVAAINGKILDCCKRGKPTADDLKAAGIGTSL